MVAKGPSSEHLAKLSMEACPLIRREDSCRGAEQQWIEPRREPSQSKKGDAATRWERAGARRKAGRRTVVVTTQQAMAWLRDI